MAVNIPASRLGRYWPQASSLIALALQHGHLGVAAARDVVAEAILAPGVAAARHPVHPDASPLARAQHHLGAGGIGVDRALDLVTLFVAVVLIHALDQPAGWDARIAATHAAKAIMALAGPGPKPNANQNARYHRALGGALHERIGALAIALVTSIAVERRRQEQREALMKAYLPVPADLLKPLGTN